MKKLVLIVMLFVSVLTNGTEINNTFVVKITQEPNLTEQMYNRMVISTRVVEFTNKYIDSKKKDKLYIPDSVWNLVKSEIDYNSFRASAVQVLNNNLTQIDIQRLINDFSQKPFIPIPNVKIKKELYDLMPSFNTSVDNVIANVLSENGYN